MPQGRDARGRSTQITSRVVVARQIGTGVGFQRIKDNDGYKDDGYKESKVGMSNGQSLNNSNVVAKDFKCFAVDGQSSSDGTVPICARMRGDSMSPVSLSIMTS